MFQLVRRFNRAHDPPKCKRFGDKVMRSFNNLVRDLGTNEGVCPEIAHLGWN